MSERRDRGLDGVRGLAALLVVLAHAVLVFETSPEVDLGILENITGLGLNGVTIFFALSGYLLYRPFARSVITGGPSVRLGTFARNRALRIFPAYLVSFVLAAFVLGVVVITPRTPDEPTGDDIGYMTDPFQIITNLTLTQGYFPETHFTGLRVSWSLCAELVFYALLPLLWLLARRIGGSRPGLWAITAPAVLMVAIGMVSSRVAIALAGDGPGTAADVLRGATWEGVLFYSIFVQAALFGLGMLAAVASVAMQAGKADPQRVASRARILFWVCVVGLVPSAFLGLQALVIAGGTACVLVLIEASAASRHGKVLLGVLESRVLDRAGVISYSIYLWHLPLAFLLRDWAPSLRSSDPLTLMLPVVLVAAITWVVSEISYRFVEQPALRRKRPMLSPAGGPTHRSARGTSSRTR